FAKLQILLNAVHENVRKFNPTVGPQEAEFLTARRAEAVTQLRTGGPGEQSGLENAVEIHDPVVTVGANGLAQPYETADATAIKHVNLVEGGVAGQDLIGFLFDDPVDLGRGIAIAQGVERGENADHVANGTQA